MKIETYASLAEGIAEHADLAIPGILGKQHATSQFWPSQPKSNTGTGVSIDAMKDLALLYRHLGEKVLQSPNNTGWICTIIMFAQQWDRFVSAQWIPTSYERPSSANWQKQIIWKEIPPANSSNSNVFWEAPFDTLFTNLIVIRDIPDDRCPPEFLMMQHINPISTLLTWPWSSSRSEQKNWLSEMEPNLEILLLGIDNHDIGLQCIHKNNYIEQFQIENLYH